MNKFDEMDKTKGKGRCVLALRVLCMGDFCGLLDQTITHMVSLAAVANERPFQD